MLLPQKAYIEFQELFYKEYGIQLPMEYAVKYADNMITLLRAIHKINVRVYNEKQEQKKQQIGSCLNNPKKI